MEMRLVSKGYFNHYFVLFCGYIRENIASSDWMIERQRLGLGLDEAFAIITTEMLH